MKISEIRELTNEELFTQRRDFKQELIHLSVQQQSGQLENAARIPLVRHSVARNETVLTARRREAAASATAAASAAAGQS